MIVKLVLLVFMIDVISSRPYYGGYGRSSWGDGGWGQGSSGGTIVTKEVKGGYQPMTGRYNSMAAGRLYRQYGGYRSQPGQEYVMRGRPQSPWMQTLEGMYSRDMDPYASIIMVDDPIVIVMPEGGGESTTAGEGDEEETEEGDEEEETEEEEEEE